MNTQKFFQCSIIVVAGVLSACSPVQRSYDSGPSSGGVKPVPGAQNSGVIKSDPLHKWGFDGVDPKNPYLSMRNDREGRFKFQLDGVVGNFTNLKISSTDNSLVFDSQNQAFPLDLGLKDVKFTSTHSEPSGAGVLSKVDLYRVGTADEKIISLNVNVLKEESRSPILFKVFDNSNPATDPGSPPDRFALKDFLNSVYSQVVYSIETIESSNKPLGYEDLIADGKNGLVDHDVGVGGAESDAIFRGLEDFNHRPVIGYVKGIRARWELDREFKTGGTKIVLGTVSAITKGMKLWTNTSNTEVEVAAISHSSFEITLKEPLTEDLGRTDYLYSDKLLGGLASPQRKVSLVVASGNCDKLKTAAHELGHQAGFGMFTDIDNSTNLMHFECSVPAYHLNSLQSIGNSIHAAIRRVETLVPGNG